MQKVEAGMCVLFFDSLGHQHNALITAVHGESKENEDGTKYHPSVNLCFVSSDINIADAYGRQMARSSSVCYQDNQSAHGMYWAFK